MPTFAIGDIHGCLRSLRLLDSALRFGGRPGDTLVTLGDYVDRGPASRGVVDYLIGLGTRCRLIALRGNHEVMMRAARRDRSLLFVRNRYFLPSLRSQSMNSRTPSSRRSPW